MDKENTLEASLKAEEQPGDCREAFEKALSYPVGPYPYCNEGDEETYKSAWTELRWQGWKLAMKHMALAMRAGIEAYEAAKAEEPSEIRDNEDDVCITRDFEKWASLTPSFLLAKDGDGEYENGMTKSYFACFEAAYTKGMWGAARKINGKLCDDLAAATRERESANAEQLRPAGDVVELERKMVRKMLESTGFCSDVVNVRSLHVLAKAAIVALQDYGEVLRRSAGSPAQSLDMVRPASQPATYHGTHGDSMEVEAAKAPATEQAGEVTAIAEKALLLAARWFKLNFDDYTFYEHPPSKADLAGMFDAMQEARENIRKAAKPEPLSLTEEELSKVIREAQRRYYEKRGLYFDDGDLLCREEAAAIENALSERYDIRRKGDVQATGESEPA